MGSSRCCTVFPRTAANRTRSFTSSGAMATGKPGIFAGVAGGPVRGAAITPVAVCAKMNRLLRSNCTRVTGPSAFGPGCIASNVGWSRGQSRVVPSAWPMPNVLPSGASARAVTSDGPSSMALEPAFLARSMCEGGRAGGSGGFGSGAGCGAGVGAGITGGCSALASSMPLCRPVRYAVAPNRKRPVTATQRPAITPI